MEEFSYICKYFSIAIRDYVFFGIRQADKLAIRNLSNNLSDDTSVQLPDYLKKQIHNKYIFFRVCLLLPLSCISLSCVSRQNLKTDLLLSWPLKSKTRISRSFSPRSPHDGIDMTALMNSKVFSAHEGYVVYAGSDYNGYGNLVILDSGQGWATFYAHLNRILVKEGRFIQRGAPIGTIGMTGKSSGPHLHFELRRNKMPVDPQKYLP